MPQPIGPKRPIAGLLFALTAAALVSACSKSEPPAKKTTSAPPAAAPAPAAPQADAPARKSVDYMAGLRNIKDESKAVTREELERSAKQVVQSAEAAKAAKAEPTKVAEAKPAPAAAAPAPVVAAPVQQAPAPTPVAPPPRPAAPADNVVAKAAPTSAAPAPSAAVSPVSRVAPDFPREAIRSGIDSGNVKARLAIDAGGNVTGVQIIESRPARVFDRTVRETLAKWKFNPGTDGRSYDTEVDFKR